MMKKFLFILLSAVCLYGCDNACAGISESHKKTNDKDLFERVYSQNVYLGDLSVYRDKHTDVLYIIYWTTDGISVEMLRNPDGSPRLYEQFKNNEEAPE